MTSRSHRPVRAVLALVALTTVLAGCFSVEATFTINDDATADVDFITLIDTARLEEFSGLLGEDADQLSGLSGPELLEQLFEGDDPCGDIVGSFSDYDVSTREIDEDGKVGVGCTASGVPLAELNSLDDDSSFMIEQADGVTRFMAVLEGVDELAGDPAETDDLVEMLGLDLDELFSIRFAATAPGSLGENNATSTDGATATWEVTPDADFVTDGDATMTAEWTPGSGGSGSSTWIILLIIAAVIAAAAVAFVLFKRSKSSTNPPGDAPTSDETIATPAMPATSPGAASPPPPPPPPATPPPPPASSPPPPSSPPSSPPSAMPPPPPPS
jgi:hypothetical protein